MSGFSDLLKGERGILAVLLIVAVTVLVFTGHATFDQWQSFVTWVFGIFATAKTATTITGLIANKQGGTDA